MTQLPLLLLLLSTVSSTLSLSTSSSDDELYCTQGFGSATEKILIQPHQINDGYCDCPFENGIDEPDTDACSGSIHWAGIATPIPRTHEEEAEGRIACPQQPNLQLSLSKINDSICDCCDGYDEQQQSQQTEGTKCPDICDMVLREERKRKEEIKKKYQIGSALRAKSIVEYRSIMKSNQQELEKLESDRIPSMQEKIEKRKMDIKSWKQGFWNAYFGMVTSLYESHWKHISFRSSDGADSHLGHINDVSTLKEIIFSVCQLYGEMISSNKQPKELEHVNMKSCLPLRLAGLDLGLIWTVQPREGSNVTMNRYIAKMEKHGVNNADNELSLNLAMLILNNHDDSGEKKTEPDELKTTLEDDDFSDYQSNISTEPGQKSRGRNLRDQMQMKKIKVPSDDDDDNDDDFGDDHGDDDEYYPDDDENEDEVDIENEVSHKNDGAPDSSDGKGYYDDEDHAKFEEDDEFMQQYHAKRREDEEIKKRADMAKPSHYSKEVDDILQRAKMAANIPDIEESRDTNSGSTPPVPGETNEKEDKIVFHSSFGRLVRGPFDEHAKNVISKIDELLNVEDVIYEDDDNEDEQQDSNDNIDPMALSIVRNALEQRKKFIANGNEMALSAKTFIQVLEDVMSENTSDLLHYLKQIIVGTIYHSSLNTEDILEMLSLVNIDEDNLTEESCFDWYYTLCTSHVNPHLINRCKERYNDNAIDICSDNIISRIPSHVSDGYHNFYTPSLSDQNDYFLRQFQNMEKLKSLFKNAHEISKVGKAISTAEDELEGLKNKAESMRNTINDKDKYGPEGVLFSLRDKCFEISPNKYTYELCMWNKAYQREGKTGKGSGTSLGMWSGSTLNEATATMVFMWKNGEKCWNGPKRSATAYVFCGAEDKLISADEPNVCEYEFRMESIIACDDNFKRLHNIVD